MYYNKCNIIHNKKTPLNYLTTQFFQIYSFGIYPSSVLTSFSSLTSLFVKDTQSVTAQPLVRRNIFEKLFRLLNVYNGKAVLHLCDQK